MDVLIPSNSYEFASSTTDEYKNLLYKFSYFQNKNKNCCMALTHLNLQCKNKIKDIAKSKSKSDIKLQILDQDSEILCKLHKRKKTKPKSIIVYIDIDYITEKQTIISYPYKNKDKYYKDIEICIKELNEKNIINLIKLNNITICKVCGDTFSNKELIKCTNTTCDNSHLTCSSCTIGYIDSQISSNIGTYECMFNKTDKCNGEYTEIIISSIIINNKTLNKWKELVTITDICKIANICDNYIICPLCRKWGCILEPCPGYETNINIKCMACNLEWCNICKRKAHVDKSCYILDFEPEENEEHCIFVIDKMIQSIISKALTHYCSSCGSIYIKEEGCNLMYCSQCNGMTCYVCNAKIYYKGIDNKYWHFAGHEGSEPGATCPVWNNVANDGKEKQGNTEYNNNKIIKELILFLMDNSKNIRDIIYNRIIFLYEKDEEHKFIANIIETLHRDDFILIPQIYLM